MKRKKYVPFIPESELANVDDFLKDWVKLDIKPQPLVTPKILEILEENRKAIDIKKLVEQLTEDGSDF
jgi:hypothetical protein